MIKIGLIGCGNISIYHIQGLREIPDNRIIAVCDVDNKKLEKVVKETGASAYSDYKKMIEDIPLDLVIINLPHALHMPCTCFCAEHNVNVFLEKPMGISESDCQLMIDACEKNNVMLWIGHLQRYMPKNIIAKKLIDSGKYGTLIGIHETRNLNYFSENRPRWFLDKKISGGGIMMNLGAHTLDKIKFYTDSEIDTSIGKVSILDGNTVESSVQAFVKTKNGIGATLNLVGYTNAEKYETILFLTGGEIRIDWGSGITACGKDGVFEVIPVSEDASSAAVAQMSDVINALITNKEPRVNGYYGKDIIQAICMIYNN